MKPSIKPYLLTVSAAIIMAFISAHYLWHGDIRNTIPWGLLSLSCGLLATDKTMAWKLGATHGFAVSYWFLWFDNTDPVSLHQFVQLFLLIPVPSLFGAFCGNLLARFGFAIQQFTARSRRGQ